MNPTNWQLAVDAVDAHTLADFWAEALHYELEDNTAVIERVVADGRATLDATFVRPDGIRSWRGFEAIRGDGRRILFHTVPEPKTVKNRWHIDLNVGHEQMAAEVQRLIALGASQLREVHEEGGHFVVMIDPEDNEFCVQ
ncbi:VOC family protein [Microlunatus panaciterrae]|uniref:Glyoxalase-like domain-containing protein n=1 Tax=Microlunatus panaciterrae TaxID=400768 RepID=A0ABS2RJF2_9ACTN|nr:VOC family protein [Microlunatus panaciterrae]MBM7799138.1 hypothetical protein [Microlunatus panaciterrae]